LTLFSLLTVVRVEVHACVCPVRAAHNYDGMVQWWHSLGSTTTPLYRAHTNKFNRLVLHSVQLNSQFFTNATGMPTQTAGLHYSYEIDR